VSTDPERNGRWRRLLARTDEVRAAVDSADPHRCPDAVVGALHALYDAWELWTQRAQLKTHAAADQRVEDQPDGELVAALIHARGGTTHSPFVEFGHFTDTISDSYFQHYGCWRWQSHSDPTPRFATRDSWYATHVAHREVLPVLEAAVAWLQQQPEIAAPKR